MQFGLKSKYPFSRFSSCPTQVSLFWHLSQCKGALQCNFVCHVMDNMNKVTTAKVRKKLIFIDGLRVTSLATIFDETCTREMLSLAESFSKRIHNMRACFPCLSSNMAVDDALYNYMILKPWRFCHKCNHLKTLDTVGNCQRLVFSLSVSQHNTYNNKPVKIWAQSAVEVAR